MSSPPPSDPPLPTSGGHQQQQFANDGVPDDREPPVNFFPVDDCFGHGIGRPALDELAQGDGGGETATNRDPASDLVTFEQFIRGGATTERKGNAANDFCCNNGGGIAKIGDGGRIAATAATTGNLNLRPIDADEEEEEDDGFVDIGLMDTARVDDVHRANNSSGTAARGRAQLYTIEQQQNNGLWKTEKIKKNAKIAITKDILRKKSTTTTAIFNNNDVSGECWQCGSMVVAGWQHWLWNKRQRQQ